MIIKKLDLGTLNNLMIIKLYFYNKEIQRFYLFQKKLRYK